MSQNEIHPTVQVLGERIAPLLQNGINGCQTACLANVDRYWNNSSITPEEVDHEVGRPEGVVVAHDDAKLWLLSRGISLETAGIDDVGFDSYLKGLIGLETLYAKIAEIEHDGDLAAARLKWDTPAVRVHWNDLQTGYMERRKQYACYVPGTNTHASYVELDERGSFELINRALDDNKLVMVCIGSVEAHEVLLFPGSTPKTFDVYNPKRPEQNLDEIIIQDINRSFMPRWNLGEKYISLEEITIAYKP